MTPQPTLLPFDLAKALPAGFGLLRPEWMHSNALPKGSAVLLSEYPKEGWLLSSFAGEIVPATNVALDRYAAPLDSAPPEAFLADAQEAGAISNDSSIAEGREVTVGLPVVRKDEACTDVTISETPDSSTGSENQAPPAVTSQRDPNDDELKAAREEIERLKAELEREREDKQTAIGLVNERGDKLQAAILRIENQTKGFRDIGDALGVTSDNESVSVLLDAAKDLKCARDHWKAAYEDEHRANRLLIHTTAEADKQRNEAIHEREAVHKLWDDILTLLGYEKGEGYPGIVGAVEKAIADRDGKLTTAETHAKSLEGLLSDLHRVFKCICLAGSCPKAIDDAWAEYGHGLVPKIDALLRPATAGPEVQP